MPEPITIVNQVVKEIIDSGKTGETEYGEWKLYKLKFMQSDKKFSWFAGIDDKIPAVGQNLLVVKYTEETKGKYTNYTIKKIEIDPTSQSSQQRVSEPTYHPVNESNNIKEISIFTAYAKDLFVAKLQIDKKIINQESGEEMSIPEICKQAVLCGKAMFNLAIGKAKATTAKPAAQPKPPAQPAPKPEPVDVPDIPFGDVVPPPEDESDLPF